MITQELKSKIVTALKSKRDNFHGSDNKFAVSIGINPAQYNRIKKGELDRVLSDSVWISLARKSEIDLTGKGNWKIAVTPVYQYVTTVLTKCQKDSNSAIICDLADIGKTFASKQYVKSNKNAVYIDCSQVKSKQKLVRYIAKEFGVGYNGRYNDVYEDLVYYLRHITNPLIILDEAGDLDYSATLELKALWNATEGCCGWVKIGADGLKEKMRRAINNKKVGFTELFSRYGSRFQRISPEGRQDLEKFNLQQAALIIRANAPKGVDIPKILKKTNGSLRRIKIEISKLN
jgi:DNA transposition AAA+ family ATPase